MAQVNKIDSNLTGTRIAKELSIGVQDPAAPWNAQEVNSYAEMGQQVTNVARSPITSDRQKKKGVLTDLDATGGFSGDITQESLPFLCEGLCYADIRDKDELAVTDITNAASDYQPASGGAVYNAGDLLFAQGFDASENNGLQEVVSGAGSSIAVVGTLVDAAGQTGTIRKCGFIAGVGDLSIVAAGDFVHILSTGVDFTTLNLIPGEWLYLGGDAVGTLWANAANNGYKRIRSISATQIVLDKSNQPMVAEAGAGLNIQLFFASRVLKNESIAALQNRSTYQIERTLGAPDDAFPAQVQSEYLIGAVASQMQLNVATADKMTFDISYVGTDMEFRSGVTGVKPSGARPALIPSEAYNSSSDVSRINMSVVSENDEAPAPLYSFIQEMTITIDNNVSPNKAVGKLGPFEITAGMFAVSGTLTAYFGNVAASEAIRANQDISIDAHYAKANQGFSFDMPLVTIGDGKPNVEADGPITLPISFEAASGNKVDLGLDHTILLMWFDFLPSSASAS